jgi:hypothetical protein
MAKRSVLPVLFLLIAAGLLGAQAQAVPSARAAAIGGPHVALADDLDTLFANPAGFRSAKPQFAVAEITLGLSGPIFDLASVIARGAGSDPATLLADPDVQALMQGLYTALNLVGPIAFGYVGNGLGFGFFDDAYLQISTRGAVPTVTTTIGERLTFAAGYSFRLFPGSWNSALDLGVLVRASFGDESAVDKDLLSFFSAFSDPASLILDAPFRISLGVALDAGLLYSYTNRFAFGIVCRSLYGPVLNYDYATLSDFLASVTPTPSNELEPIDLSAGLMFRPPLGFLGRYVSDFKLLLDYSDILDFLTHPATSTNPVLHAGLGMELVLLEILSVRAGFYQGLASAGLGFRLGKLTLNLAMFGTELSPEPGLRPVFNLMLELAFTL